MQTASTVAWVLHDVGLAAGFGGNLFGKIALGPAVRDISMKDRGKVLSKAWDTYKIVDALSFGAAAATWFIGRGMLSGRESDSVSRGLVLAKDILMGATVATSATNIICGTLLSQDQKDGKLVVESGSQPAAQTSKKDAVLQRIVNVLGDVNLLTSAGIIGLTAALAMRSGRSARWSVVSRFLP